MDTNVVTLIDGDEAETLLPKMSKLEVADRILDWVIDRWTPDAETIETLKAVRTFVEAQAEFGLTEFRRAGADARLADFHESIRDCRLCGLCEQRAQRCLRHAAIRMRD